MVKDWFLQIHDLLAKFLELLPLERLCKIVSYHVIGATVLNLKFLVLDAISDEVIANVDVLGPLTGRLLAMVLKEDSRLVVLIQGGVLETITLCFEKVVRP